MIDVLPSGDIEIRASPRRAVWILAVLDQRTVLAPRQIYLAAGFPVQYRRMHATVLRSAP
jgi:hypothetical protein